MNAGSGPHELVAVGLDMGTQGARAVAVDLKGRLLAEGRAELPRGATRVQGACVEQDPQAWSDVAEAALGQMMTRVPAGCRIVGIAVDATSGTFVLVDGAHAPLTPGLMYNDLRATAEAPGAAAALRDVLAPYGISIAAAFALPKILHLMRQHPELVTRCRRVVHQTDWLVGRLCDRYDVTDISTALKTGADPGRLVWPAALQQALGVPLAWLPEIVLPGTPVGTVTPAAAARTGVPVGTPVVAGCTDGTAGCLASGAREIGDLNVTLGTTLIFKAIAAEPLRDPQGEVYNHRHPAGGYLPGAASSTGGDWIPQHFPGTDLDALGQEAATRLPTGRTAYPLVKTGERFPFAHPQATGFGLADIPLPAERFAAGLEGVALLERLGIERLEQLGLVIGPTVYATGGGAASATWLRIRASATGRTYAVPQSTECAVGAAVLAAVPHCGRFADAAAALVRPGRQVEPDPHLTGAYAEAYGRFVAALRERGYW